MTDQDLLITRIFNAPRNLVWQAWTEPEQVKRWQGPKGFIIPEAKVDLRVGGTSLLCMRSPDGKDYWSTGTYREIVEMEKIVETDSFADEKGNEVPASYYGMEGDWPDNLLVTVTFEDTEKDKTLFTLRHSGLPTNDIREQTGISWNEILNKLAVMLAGD